MTACVIRVDGPSIIVIAESLAIRWGETIPDKEHDVKD